VTFLYVFSALCARNFTINMHLTTLQCTLQR
jgi:hypothetical protein